MCEQLYVVVQAGGRGSRLRHHTWNKPKCLVSVRGKPLLYHLFDRFPTAKFIIIGDYAFPQLEKYLIVNPPEVNYQLIQTYQKGTLSGIGDALKIVPPDSPLILTWSDLIIGELPRWPKSIVPVVCTTSAFTCRWTVSQDGLLRELPGANDGVPGLFYFDRASYFPTPPDEGEFVKWFAANISKYELLDCNDMEELGDFSSIEESNNRLGFCRFFNKVEIGDKVTKTVIDQTFNSVHECEVEWYKQAVELGFRRIPKIYSEKPLVMERIYGDHAYQMNDLSEREMRAVLADYLDTLISLHDKKIADVDLSEIKQVYFEKTKSRVDSVAGIIPGFERKAVTVNGKKCRNIFHPDYVGELEQIVSTLVPDSYASIHGDPTFSNSLIDDKLRVWFIDPRGYFLKPGIFGDPWYDFAKVYYSAVGGYDLFNRRKFKLHVDESTVDILMEEPIFAKTAKDIFKDYFGSNCSRIEILHALIWLSFSGYVKDDMDSVIAAYYYGLYWLEGGISNNS